MPITKSLVELMNGHIEVSSEKGKGSTFTVTITLGQSNKKKAEAENEKTTIQSSNNNKIDLQGCRVLLAEDMPVNAEIMKMVLSMKKIEVERAENGKIAVEMFKNHDVGYYSAILMDMRMPEMDGLEATRIIRAMEREDAKTIPIIALTANAFYEDVQRSMQAGLNAHLSKPVEPDILFKTLENLIKI
jgi:CheY-like chemotaxis protein